jgi:hypothetical protein
MDKDRDKGMDRREFIRKAAITGAVAWAVPVIQTVGATPAYAGNGTVLCQHSIGGDTGDGCQGACQASDGCGNDCNDICGPTCDCPGRFCPCDEICDSANWENCEYVGPACTGPCP